MNEELYNEYQNRIQSRVYSDGREEQIRIPDRITGFDGVFERKIPQDENTTHVQTFVNNVSAPKSLEELIFLVENSGRFTVEELLYDDTTWIRTRGRCAPAGSGMDTDGII